MKISELIQLATMRLHEQMRFNSKRQIPKNLPEIKCFESERVTTKILTKLLEAFPNKIQAHRLTHTNKKIVSNPPMPPWA